MPSSEPDSRSRRGFRLFFVVFVAAFTCRGACGVGIWLFAESPYDLMFPDERQYWAMAQSFAREEGLRDEVGFRATRMPAYPVLLSLVAGSEKGIGYAKAAQWVLGALAAPLAAGIALRLVGRRPAWVAGILVAVDPHLMFISSRLLTETLFLTSVTLLWFVTCPILRKTAQEATFAPWLILGVCAALSVHARETALGLVGLLLGLILVRHRFQPRVLAGTVFVAVLVFLVLLPWAWRNHRVIGRWCFLTTRGGISLYDGVGPQADGSSNLGDVKQMPTVRGLSEVEWNDFFLAESWRSIRENPARIARLAWIKLRRTWNPFPNLESASGTGIRVVSGTWTIGVFTFCTAGLWGLRRFLPYSWGFAGVFLLLPAAYISVLHALFVGSLRYRLLAMPFLEILAAAGLGIVAQALALRWRGGVAERETGA